MLTETAKRAMYRELDGADARPAEVFLAAQDREALAEVLAKIADPGAFTGEGYAPGAMKQSREDAMGRAREQIDVLLDGDG